MLGGRSSCVLSDHESLEAAGCASRAAGNRRAGRKKRERHGPRDLDAVVMGVSAFMVECVRLQHFIRNQAGLVTGRL